MYGEENWGTEMTDFKEQRRASAQRPRLNINQFCKKYSAMCYDERCQVDPKCKESCEQCRIIEAITLYFKTISYEPDDEKELFEEDIKKAKDIGISRNYMRKAMDDLYYYKEIRN